MADVTQLKVAARERAGKGSARAARRQGLVPAVVYGDKKPPVIITISRNELVRLFNRGGFMTQLFELKLDDKGQKVLPRDLQLHPVTSEPMHVDFLRLSVGAKIVIEIPVHFIGEEEAPGLSRGGVLNIVRHTIECNCPMDAIPEFLEASLAGLDIGGSVHISEMTLPEGVEPTISDRDFTVATIAAPVEEIVEEVEEIESLEEGEEGLEEGEEGVEGEEGAEGEEASAEDGKKEDGKKEDGRG